MRTRSMLVLSLALLLCISAVGSVSGIEEPVIVEGFDITASVTGMPLKEVFKDNFKIGVGLYGNSIQTDSLNHGAIAEIIKYHFNSTTYTNLMKPSYLLDQLGSVRNYSSDNPEPAVKFDSVIKGLDFCRDNNLQMRGHVLVWHAQTPDWFFREGYLPTAPYVDRETMLFRMESYIRQVLEFVQSEYPGVIYAWDVVNEAIDNTPGYYETQSGFNIRTKHGENQDNLWYKIIGIDYVEKAFEFARKYADPDVKLFYNDYNTFQTARREAIYRLASRLKEKGLIDGIGMQSYIGLDYPDLNSYKQAIQRFGELGLEIHVTELSIDAGGTSPELYERQAQRYGDVFKILLDLDDTEANITSVTLFGLMDHYILYDDDTQTNRLFDGNLQPKPAFYQVVDPSKPWYINKSRYEGAVKFIDADGNILAQLVPGEYRIDLTEAVEFWVARGYILELYEGTEADPRIFIGSDDQVAFPEVDQVERIVVKENTEINLALNKPVAASHRADRAERAVDGQVLSSWTVNEEPPYWISVDLGDEYLLTRWVVYHRGGGGVSADSVVNGPINTADFCLQISTDQETWADLDVVEDNTLGRTDRSITPTKARYVRLLITRPTSLAFNREAVVYEFEVYGLTD